MRKYEPRLISCPEDVFSTIKDVDTENRNLSPDLLFMTIRKRKKRIVCINKTIKHASGRLLIDLPSCFGFRIWSQVISQSYFQSASALQRDIYLKRGNDFKIKGNQLINLLRPLYSFFGLK